MAKMFPIKIQVEHVYTLSDEARRLLELLEAAVAKPAQGKHAQGPPIPVKVIKSTATDFEREAADVERRLNEATERRDNPDAWTEPVCIFCGATSATANMFKSADDGMWRCQSHS